jgi:hypothetical protein
VLGAELLGFSLIVVLVTVYLETQTLKRIEARRRVRWGLRDMVFNTGVVTILVAGATVFAGSAGGLYWLVPTVLIFFVWSMINAWALLVWVAQR